MLLIEGVDGRHILVTEREVKQVYVLNHTLTVRAFRYDNYTALHAVLECDLAGALAVFCANLVEKRMLYQLADTLLSQRPPSFMLDVVLFHPTVQLMLLEEHVGFNLLNHRRNFIEQRQINETLRRSVADAYCAKTAFFIVLLKCAVSAKIIPGRHMDEEEVDIVGRSFLKESSMAALAFS